MVGTGQNMVAQKDEHDDIIDPIIGHVSTKSILRKYITDRYAHMKHKSHTAMAISVRTNEEFQTLLYVPLIPLQISGWCATKYSHCLVNQQVNQDFFV